MSRRLFRVLTLLLTSSLFLVFASACAPNTKNETERWQKLQTTVGEHSARWPGFKAVLDARAAKAKIQWEEALKVSDKEAKAKKMKETNEFLQELAGKLDEVKYKSEAIEKTITKINKLKLPKSKSSSRKSKIESARGVLDEVEKAMVAAAPADEAAALALLKEQVSKLISGKGAADRAYKSLDGGGSKKSRKKKK